MAIELKPNGLGLSAGRNKRNTSGALKAARNGSDLNKRYKAAELRSRLAEMRSRLIAGQPDVEICFSMGLDTRRYNELKRELYRQEVADFRNLSTEEVYLEYKFAQTGCILDLDEQIARLRIGSNQQAVVSAIRAKSDIIDKVIKMGQDMGVLDKAPERKLVLHGHAVAQLDNSDLRQLIAKEMEGLAAVIHKFGDHDMAGNQVLIDVEPVPEPVTKLAEVPNGPKFSDNGKSHLATGGLAKVKGGKARGRQMKQPKAS